MDVIMLLGIAIKNYKVYKNLQYIPISLGSKFSAFLGPNGIGKTSIFEAIDRFFNGGDWVINNEAKKISEESAFIAPLFLIPIDDISLNKKEKKLALILIDYFWSYAGAPYNTLIKYVKDAAITLAEAGIGKDTHYLIMLGNIYQTNKIHIPLFENDIAKIIEENFDIEFEDLDGLLKKIKEYYRYIYLPAEADSINFSKMESIYTQRLLDEDIKKTIQSSISKDILKEINGKLKEFIDQINNSLDSYVYKSKRKEQLTTNDLIDRIFSAYFGTKVLNKKNGGRETLIKDLSSGEKSKH